MDNTTPAPSCPPALARSVTDELLEACDFKYSRDEIQRALQLAGHKLVQAALLLGSSSTSSTRTHCTGPHMRLMPESTKSPIECALCLSPVDAKTICQLPCGIRSCVEVTYTCVCMHSATYVRIYAYMHLNFLIVLLLSIRLSQSVSNCISGSKSEAKSARHAQRIIRSFRLQMWPLSWPIHAACVVIT